jgi:hypothetical protein
MFLLLTDEDILEMGKFSWATLYYVCIKVIIADLSVSTVMTLSLLMPAIGKGANSPAAKETWWSERN